MRPFKEYVLATLDLIEPLPLETIAPAHGPILRDRPKDYVARYRELATPRLQREIRPGEKTLLIFYISIEDRLRGLKLRVPVPGVRIKLIPTPEEIEECRRFGQALGEYLMGRRAARAIDMADLFVSTHA
jgi:flavorubredoxin